MKTWLEPLSTPIAEDLREVVSGHPVVAQRLITRELFPLYTATQTHYQTRLRWV